MKNNKFIAQPFVPKTETRIVLERKEEVPSLVKFANCLGIKTVYSCNEKPSECAAVALKLVADAASKATSEHGGKTETKVNNDGSVSITYTTPKKK